MQKIRSEMIIISVKLSKCDDKKISIVHFEFKGLLYVKKALIFLNIVH